MSSFVVDPYTLEALQATLAGLAGDLSSMHGTLHPPEGSLGGGSLEGDIGSFLGAWHTGIALMEGDMQNVVERLGQAAKAYAQSESLVSGSCGGGS
ncbi:MAG TPA: hypothetical protein VHX88_14910 [Solirubrobacteraceae bacterium]|jgi:hypothetical protein|nr:hypothetical protein [Solirubrobacteraceae bacterium]